MTATAAPVVEVDLDETWASRPGTQHGGFLLLLLGTAAPSGGHRLAGHRA